MNQGERVGIIGRNGIGKSTLLKLIAGMETPDEGQLAFNRDLKVEYLAQNPDYDPEDSVLQVVMGAKAEVFEMLREHASLCNLPAYTHDEKTHRRLEELALRIDAADGWNLETEAQIILQKLGSADFRTSIAELSGGQRKRVALARVLLSDPDLLILDEPTNHLDADSVQWLQDRLQTSAKALLLVTHDRYFLDAVCNRIVELDQTRLFSYPGNYEAYLELKEASLNAQESAAERTRSRLRKELVWLQRGVKARRTKQKSRIDWIARMKAEPKVERQKDIKIDFGAAYLGGRIIDATNIAKSIDGKLLFKNFSYVAAPGDRIGIIGPNGTGKSTLLKTLNGELPPDSGRVKIGTTVNIGFFAQEPENLPDSQTVIGSVREVAEYINVGVGRERFLTARDMLLRFLFPTSQHYSQLQTLSGGERRRLALLRILMANPNVLMLDEPTNDFDIATLTALEDYLSDFRGCLIAVSHDRAFLDRTADFIYAFEPDGVIKQYPGNYSQYLEFREESERARKTQEKQQQQNAVRPKSPKQRSSAKKLSYREQKEFQALEKSIAEFEDLKSALEHKLNGGGDYKAMAELGEQLAEIETRLDGALERWMELSELAQG